MVKAVRASCRTYQLFEITKAVLEKNDRFIVVLQRARAERPMRQSRAPEGAAVAEGSPESASKPAQEKLNPMYMSQPDHLPFEISPLLINVELPVNCSGHRIIIGISKFYSSTMRLNSAACRLSAFGKALFQRANLRCSPLGWRK
jgi:hypothetical protein